MVFFLSPFLFLLPILFVAVSARAVSHLFRQLFRDGTTASSGPPTLVAGAGRGVQSRIFRTAYRLGGMVTLSDVVIETGLDLGDAEALMDRMVDEVRVRMVIEQCGSIVYEFPEVVERVRRERR